VAAAWLRTESGASVGDCGAWLVDVNGIDDLTYTNPEALLGSGEAGFAFEAFFTKSDPPTGDRWPAEVWPAAIASPSGAGGRLQVAVQQLAELPRLRSGALPTMRV